MKLDEVQFKARLKAVSNPANVLTPPMTIQPPPPILPPSSEDKSLIREHSKILSPKKSKRINL